MGRLVTAKRRLAISGPGARYIHGQRRDYSIRVWQMIRRYADDGCAGLEDDDDDGMLEQHSAEGGRRQGTDNVDTRVTEAMKQLLRISITTWWATSTASVSVWRGTSLS